MNIMLSYFGALLTILLFSFCSPKTAQIQHADKGLPDGVYLLAGNCEELKKNNSAKNFRKVNYNYRFVETDEQTTDCLVIDESEFVPLHLQKEPDLQPDPEKRNRLLLELTSEAKLKLTAFTKKHLNQRVAMVIAEEVVTMHVIRAVIDGGYLQITRCTDNACEFLDVELRDNVVGQDKKQQ